MTQAQFLQRANTSWKMRLFLFWKLPAAWFVGIRVKSCDPEKCVVLLPYGWRAQNPFRSTYFAAQCAAGELSTGLLAMSHLQEQPPVSMLVTNVEADFFKKASQTLAFTCTDGEALANTIAKAIATGEAQVFQAHSLGCLPDGTLAVQVRITWSFKVKKR